MTIVQVEARNIQGLKYALVEPEEMGTTVVGGKNKAGKTSLLNAIAWTLGGEKLCPEHPIREGQQTAECSVELTADAARMFPACKVIRKWKRNKKGEEDSVLSIRTADGFAAPSPQSILDTIIGTLGFEPEKFLRASEKEQVKILRELVGLDFEALDQEYALLYSDRTKNNKAVEAARVQHEAKKFHPDAPEQPVSVRELMEELKTREEHLTRCNEMRLDAQSAFTRWQSAEQHLIQCDAALLRATQARDDAALALEERNKEAVTARLLAEAVVDPNVEEIRKQITDADETNRKQRENAEKAVLRAAHEKLVKDSEWATNRLAKILEEKQTATAAAKWPIEGLGFNDDGVTFNGRQFQQASTMEQIKTAVAIRAALAPSLQFAFIRDGSLLDDEQLALLAAFAAEKNLQLFIERVGAGTECDIVISDGRIVGQEEPPADEPEKPKPKKPQGTLL